MYSCDSPEMDIRALPASVNKNEVDHKGYDQKEFPFRFDQKILCSVRGWFGRALQIVETETAPYIFWPEKGTVTFPVLKKRIEQHIETKGHGA
jgi:hypothetical protein